MTDQALPQIAQLTPPGRGAVATFAVEGPGASLLVQSRFRAAAGGRLTDRPKDRVVFGRLMLSAGASEEAVVRLRSADSVELHCHGGHAATAAVEKALVAAGGRAVDWSRWVAASEKGATAAAARVALAQARTWRTAAILLDQYHGALGRAAEAIRSSLARQDFVSASEAVDALSKRVGVGRHLVTPWQVVLAGPPNVGKSSLINALVGYERVIVDASPGTTRDVVTATAAVEGWPVELSDTAGLHEGGLHAVERAGIALARERLARAELALLVFDWSRPWTEADARLVQVYPAALVVHNKRDLPMGSGPQRPEGVVTSALTGEGIEMLVSGIAERIVPLPPPSGAAVPFTDGQIETLRLLSKALGGGDVESAVTAARELM